MWIPRLQLVELEDLAWFPTTIRDFATDYLRFMQSRAAAYRPAVPLVRDALRAVGSTRIVDLCSGGGGPIPGVARALRQEFPELSVTLTDRYPNLPAFRLLAEQMPGLLRYERRPVDARAVPAHLHGVRTLFHAFHHFGPRDARRVLTDAVRAREAIVVIDLGARRVALMFLVLLAPIFVLLTTPAIRPFRWTRLLFTYLIPLVPLTCLWDGLVSTVRPYTPAELVAMAREVAAEEYEWRSGTHPVPGSPVPFSYLVGWPARRTGDRAHRLVSSHDEPRGEGHGALFDRGDPG